MASKTLNGKERPKNMIDPDDAVMLLIDHQSGLFQTVKDMEVTVYQSTLPLCVRKSSRPGAAQTRRNGLKPMRVCSRHINC
jgi:hypothetical protein